MGQVGLDHMIGGTMSGHGDQQGRPGPTALPPGSPCAGRRDSAMRLLASGIPLSLLMDLATPGGPHSREILAVEGAPTQT
ncbi:MAG TPA: hypothetical protein VFP72_15355 [Kineosporiaceae bacterium]|nr:hypothetical protein [Kineosporiaceae bacterium]